ncbi:hypothetical protein NUU61_005741 [Penicillium alfredii]|uniref:Protein kinase domain-containing protein n=1 Tax=Penicillium alfredii TaxID=1506179 RepID=A0A9W9FA90_9EURO|nr:uncharacterized protein NUU61_005741 [Penicillium alfredii]KAJ5096385.1 hypothetical protein NUU61_005741 [Penicillium alfredii]
MTRNGQPSVSLLLVKQKNHGADGQVWEAKLAYYNTQDNAYLQLPIGRDLDVGVKLSRGGTAIDQAKLQERVTSPWVMPFREQFYSTNTDQSVQVMELETMGAMGEVLKEAHRVDVINRDVKPENILFMRNGFRYMIDWDHARYVPGHWDGTGWVGKGICHDFSGGTPTYKGPEWKNREPYDGPKNDVFAWTMTWLWADQRSEMTNMLQDSIARRLHQPRSGAVAPGLTYDATNELLGNRFPGMRPEKVQLMARGLCKQDERWTMGQMLYWYKKIPHY